MFRHQGKSRTQKHNLQIATVLSFVAGIVNVTGFLALQQLTTNVTGHFALFINDVSNFEFWRGTVYFLYILAFLLGSFTSGFLIEKYKRSQKMNVFVLPTVAESTILIFVAIWGSLTAVHYPDVVACLLLFAMGLQNSYVTKISDAIVRTTHLTGLFTDLGIELAQLFFPVAATDRQRLMGTIKLRLFIICFFFMGGLVGGFLYSRVGMHLHTLLVAAVILLLSLFYDDLRAAVVRPRK